MGLLDQLWDDTVAGPRPDSGLSRLRKYSSFSSASASSAAAAAAAAGGLQVTRSITVLRTNTTTTTPSSSAASSPRSNPESPLGPLTPRGDGPRLRRRAKGAAPEGMETAEPRNPTVYDWVVISSLDR